MNSTQVTSPVAVGGVGGSGTRVVAEILKRAGLYMGGDLNESNDNLWFTLLLKRPAWFIENAGNNEAEILRGISVFAKAMTGEPIMDDEDLSFLQRATLDMARHGHDHLGSGSGAWAYERSKSLLNARNARPAAAIGWGWKEPNTHLFIEYLAKRFDRLKYIHVMRHGLDMAYSNNQGQLYNWGKLFGVVPDSSQPLPKASLQYWIKANTRALDVGRKLLGDRFLPVNFDKLCLDPVREITRLLGFLGVDKGAVDFESLVALPRVPKSTGRYREQDLSIFSGEEIAAVRELGFDVQR